MTTYSITTVDDHRIQLVSTCPEKPKAIVILCHGLGATRDESRGLFIDLARKLFSSIIASVRFNFRGYGDSNIPSDELTLSGQKLDLISVCEAVEKRTPGVPVAIVAASFSASAAVAVATEKGKALKCLALWNPVLDYERTFVNPVTEWGESIICKKCSDGSAPTPIHGHLPNKDFDMSSLLYEEMSKDQTMKKLSCLPMPILIAHGLEDTKVPVKFTVNINNIREQSGYPTETMLLSNEDHGFRGSRNLVINKTISWLTKQVSSKE